MVKRTYQPGCEHRWMPILIGDQNMGKSLSIRELFPADWQRVWFTDAPELGIKPKELIEAVGGAVAIEYAEVAGVHYTHTEKIKAQLSRRQDTARMAYDRASTIKQRAFVAVGTANDTGNGILPDDPSGHSRFVAVPVDIDSDFLIAYMNEFREQMWAEALHIYRQNPNIPTWLSKETAAEREEAAERHVAEDLYAVAIEHHFSDTLRPPMVMDMQGHWYDAASIAVCAGITEASVSKLEGVRDIQRELSAARNRSISTRVGIALKKLGWQKGYKNAQGKRMRLYLRPGTANQRPPTIEDTNAVKDPSEHSLSNADAIDVDNIFNNS